MIHSIILEEQKATKYFFIILDATPDSSHTEQTTFILSYVTCQDSCIIQERFLQFVDCNKKTGADIAQLILKFLDSHRISISNCRGQGYDHGSNMAGKYNSAQTQLLPS